MEITSAYSLPSSQDGALLAKAFLRAGNILRLTQKELSGVLGVSEPTLSRLVHKGHSISPQDKDGEIALLFLRIFRSLDALFGGHEVDMQKWFDSPNHYLKGIPRNLIKSLQGLFDVASYLDAMRGQV
jgi:hypothetical protein